MKEIYKTGSPPVTEIMPVNRQLVSTRQTEQGHVGSRSPSEGQSDTGQKEQLKAQAESMNRMLEVNYTNLKFNIHEDLNRVYVQVLERDTEEVIREVPPEKFLDMVAAMMEQIGILVDEKV